MGKNTGFSDMVLAIVDRVEDDVLVLMTDTRPTKEIHLPVELFQSFSEGDVVRIIVEKDEERREEIENEIKDQRKLLKSVRLSCSGT
ncbi:DUF3006 family protein [Methanospirillum hungatei]|uniref:DUF3006 family protein n=1 Tax=Methanospirillum hungatei TaxID=2203 RepID=UPI0026E987E1|nr:DUF3006 family protein [Methanospirillum hungatei]MCA1915638.1 DUF3006 domain-containing protein [Methanospirillum hungatei]